MSFTSLLADFTLSAVQAATSEIRVPPEAVATPFGLRLRSAVGLVVLLGIAWSLSSDRRRIPWRVLGWGLCLQLLFAVVVLRTDLGVAFFDGTNQVVQALLGFSVDGARFLFGNLVESNVPVGQGEPGQGTFTATTGLVANTGAFFAFTVLPAIIFFSSLVAVLYHLGIMQAVVRAIAWVMQRTMGTSGSETLVSAGNIFFGLSEAPLLVRPFVERMTRSELMTVMSSGMASVSGALLAAYVGLLVGFFPDIAGHLVAASIMTAPGALVVAKLMVPETEVSETAGTLDVRVGRSEVNVIDAAARGASEGLHLALAVGAMLIAFLALVSLSNGVIGWAGSLAGLHDLSLERILGWALAPLTWLMGVPWTDAPAVASLVGVKTVVNEFVAYLQLADGLSAGTTLEPRSVVIASYALCGFANFGSVAMTVGGIAVIAPSRRRDLAELGLKAMVGGGLATLMAATIAGMVI
jgi:CNT family concentrative nucleoside transporter